MKTLKLDCNPVQEVQQIWARGYQPNKKSFYLFWANETIFIEINYYSPKKNIIIQVHSQILPSQRNRFKWKITNIIISPKFIHLNFQLSFEISILLKYIETKVRLFI